MNEQIVAALQQLDPSNADHWTSDGLPRVDTVKELASLQWLSRDQINAAAPGLTRTALEQYRAQQGAAQAPATPAVATQEPLAVQQPQQEPSAAPAPATPPVVEETVAGERSPEEIRLAEIDEALAEAKQQISDAQKVLEGARQELDRVNAIADKLVTEREQLLNRIPNLQGDSIRDYLRMQVELRQKRAQQARMVAPDPRSPLDKAIASRTVARRRAGK